MVSNVTSGSRTPAANPDGEAAVQSICDGLPGTSNATGCSLSERQLAAVELELDDRQRDLIDDLWHLSEGLINRVQVPDTVIGQPDQLVAPWSAQLAKDFQLLTQELRTVIAALSAVHRRQYGNCQSCHQPMAAAELLADMCRSNCSSCQSAAV